MKKIKKISLGLLVAGLLSGIGGCAVQHGANVERVADSSIDVTHPRAELVLASTELLRKLVMVNVRFGAVGTLQRAEFGMQNVSSKKLVLEYKVEWQDQGGFTVSNNSVWHRFSLAPKEMKNMQTVGKVPEAYKIQVITRLPDDLFIESHKQEVEDNKKWYQP